ncbi:MAG: Crp/Fnr family transcriptional regulator [Bacteroidales bacterium]|nr:Crp/Fnr family transcriptional regulator [Bacteroidales bacterium]
MCKQGAFASYVLYISEGLVKLYLENNNQKITNVQLLQSGSFIGLSSVFGKNIYNYSVVALKNSEVCLIEKEGLRNLLEKNGLFASSVIKNYSNTEAYLFEKLKSLSYKQMNGRIADALLYLSDNSIFDENIFPYLSRKDLADFACVSTESTVKILGELKTEGIIDMKGKTIDILEPERLKQISRLG